MSHMPNSYIHNTCDCTSSHCPLCVFLTANSPELFFLFMTQQAIILSALVFFKIRIEQKHQSIHSCICGTLLEFLHCITSPP